MDVDNTRNNQQYGYRNERHNNRDGCGASASTTACINNSWAVSHFLLLFNLPNATQSKTVCVSEDKRTIRASVPSRDYYCANRASFADALQCDGASADIEVVGDDVTRADQEDGARASTQESPRLWRRARADRVYETRSFSNIREISLQAYDYLATASVRLRKNDDLPLRLCESG